MYLYRYIYISIYLYIYIYSIRFVQKIFACGFEVQRAVHMWSTAFRIITPWSLVHGLRHFEWACYFHLQGKKFTSSLDDVGPYWITYKPSQPNETNVSSQCVQKVTYLITQNLRSPSRNIFRLSLFRLGIGVPCSTVVSEKLPPRHGEMQNCPQASWINTDQLGVTCFIISLFNDFII